jgi:hypothetical protein
MKSRRLTLGLSLLSFGLAIPLASLFFPSGQSHALPALQIASAILAVGGAILGPRLWVQMSRMKTYPVLTNIIVMSIGLLVVSIGTSDWYTRMLEWATARQGAKRDLTYVLVSLLFGGLPSALATAGISICLMPDERAAQ